jgi:DNA repair photolyase
MTVARVENPPNPWQTTHVEWLGEPPPAALEVFVDHTREILSRNDSPDIPFTFSVNPYRGCMHACAYCYARPTHEYLGFGAGTDFDRRIVIKPEAPRLLTVAFEHRSWTGELVVFSGNTDCYQPVEASYRLTRACLEVCRTYRNPVAIITKSPLVERDIDVLRALAAHGAATVTVSVPFANPDHARAVEPCVPPPARRIEAIRRLAEAGIPVGVNVAPIIPGLNDAELVEVLERAHAAGARHAGMVMLRLPGPVAEVFERRIRAALPPSRAERILRRVEEVRGGRRNDPRFGTRMCGEGEYADVVSALFTSTCRRLGLVARTVGASMGPSPFRRPPPERGQLDLFGATDPPGAG